MRRGKASLYGRPDSFAEYRLRPCLSRRALKDRMHTVRACCRFGFSRRFGALIFRQFAVLFPAALLLSTGLRGVAQTASSAGHVSIDV
jgi:hypothetical protein